MHKEVFADRLARALRLPAMIGALICGPVFLISYGWVMRDFFLSAPLFVSTPIGAAHVVVWLGFAAWLDTRRNPD
jgi:hypothetical protein